MKKLTALLLALVMVLAMNVNAFALEGEAFAGTTDSTNLTDFTIDVILHKVAAVMNPEETVTFTVVPAEPSEVANPYQVGPANGIKFANNGDNTATFAANLTDADNTATIKLTTDVDSFGGKPGIYRYKITETTPLDKAALGFATSDVTTKYIDVYVKNVTGGTIIYGIVMGELNTDTDGQRPLKNKDANFDISYTTNNGGTPTTPGDDTPKSYDVTISKVLGNGGAEDPNEIFTFKLTVGALAAAAGVKIPVTFTGGATGDAEITLADASNTYDYSVKGGSTIKLSGMPLTLALQVVETVAGLDGYTTTATVTDMNNPDTATNRQASGTVKGENGTMTITNTRTTISPTGVVLRVAPYAIMLGAGVVLFIILKSRKNKAVEEA